MLVQYYGKIYKIMNLYRIHCLIIISHHLLKELQNNPYYSWIEFEYFAKFEFHFLNFALSG